MVQKKFWSKKIVGPTNYLSKKCLGRQEIYVQNIWSKKILVKKNWVQKKFGSKNYDGSDPFLCQKIFEFKTNFLQKNKGSPKAW